MSFVMKQNDREPAYTGTITVSGEAVDLTGRTVTFVMADAVTEVVKVEAAADIDDAENGEVSYAWEDGDTDTAGLYKASWVVSTGGLPRTFPAVDYLYILIEPALSP